MFDTFRKKMTVDQYDKELIAVENDLSDLDFQKRQRIIDKLSLKEAERYCDGDSPEKLVNWTKNRIEELADTELNFYARGRLAVLKNNYSAAEYYLTQSNFFRRHDAIYYRTQMAVEKKDVFSANNLIDQLDGVIHPVDGVIHPLYFRMRAKVKYITSGLNDGVVADFNLALRGGNREVYRDLAEIYFKEDKVDLALSVLEIGIENGQNECWCLLGKIHDKLGNKIKAKKCFEEAIKFGDQEAWRAKAVIFREEKKSKRRLEAKF